ncbi:DedA family protein [Kitasatospora sp. NPDC059571]|uniref:DedA family protein n=1 Tax=Kitasatospora sp. NPDC059571 TaxID=3346871 RepID=UPI003688BD1C
MPAVTDWLHGLSGPVIYTVIAVLVFCEDAAFIGFLLPGETAVEFGGLLAHHGRISLWLLCTVVVAAAIAGDSVGYEIGRRFGPGILNLRPLRRHRARVERAERLVRRRGPAAVFLGRFIAFFRAVMPALAGISRMPYRRFLLSNAVGGLISGVGYVLLGYYAGDAYSRAEGRVGHAAAIAITVAVVVGLLVWHFRGRRTPGPRTAGAGHREAPDPTAPRSDG